MKRKLVFLSIAAAGLCLFAGCGNSDITESTVELKRNGRIVEYTIEDFSESYYDADELQSYIDSAVEEWTGDNEGSIRVKRSEVEDGTAYLTAEYDSAETFADFNGVECFAGNIVQARSAGYDFDMDFIRVNNDEDEEEGSVDAEIQTLVSGDTVLQDDEQHVLIIRNHVDLKVPGEITYVSADHTEVKDSQTVSVDLNEDTAVHDILIYVVYK